MARVSFRSVVDSRRPISTRARRLVTPGRLAIAHAADEGPVMRDTVFIHSNRKQRLGALVSAHSLRTRSVAPDAFDVRILWAEDYLFIAARDGQPYLREGRKVLWVQDAVQ